MNPPKPLNSLADFFAHYDLMPCSNELHIKHHTAFHTTDLCRFKDKLEAERAAHQKEIAQQLRGTVRLVEISTDWQMKAEAAEAKAIEWKGAAKSEAKIVDEYLLLVEALEAENTELKGGLAQIKKQIDKWATRLDQESEPWIREMIDDMVKTAKLMPLAGGKEEKKA